MSHPVNAIVEYVDAATGAVVATDEFYDPGLSRGVLAYGCGRRLLGVRVAMKRAALAAAVLVLAAPCALAQNAFAPGGPTVSLAVTGTTGRVQVQTAANSAQMRVYNAGSVPVFLACGDVTATATVAAGMPIAPASVEVLTCAQQYVAGISAGTAATLYITPGAGI